MLVLNTTSPPVTPGAPAALPRNQVPSSSARIASILSSPLPFPAACTSAVERRRHPMADAAHDADGRRPTAVPVALEPDDVFTGADLRQRERRHADLAAIQKHPGSCRTRLDVDGARDGSDRGGRP